MCACLWLADPTTCHHALDAAPRAARARPVFNRGMTRTGLVVVLATGGLASAVLAFLSQEPVQLALITGFGTLTSVIVWRSLGALAAYVRAKVESAVTSFEAMGSTIERLEVGQKELAAALAEASRRASRMRSRVVAHEARLNAHSSELRGLVHQLAALRGDVAAATKASP